MSPWAGGKPRSSRGAQLGGNAEGGALCCGRRSVVLRGPKTREVKTGGGAIRQGQAWAQKEPDLLVSRVCMEHLSWARRGQGVKGRLGPASLTLAFFRRVTFRVGKGECPAVSVESARLRGVLQG